MFMNWLVRFGYNVIVSHETSTAFTNGMFVVAAFSDCITIARIDGSEYHKLEFTDREFMNRVCGILDLR